ncbi:MAG: VanW family protein [Lachnospiraceae bacterium]|nr:VanW family protein [Lachnospiraceae bacterium]
MKKFSKWGARICCAAIAVLCMGFVSKAAPDPDVTIKDGIYAGQDSLAGMTADEAQSMIREKINDMANSHVTLVAAGGHEITVTARDLGISWANPELVEEAVTLGTKGNVIQRYKLLKDLQFENKVYDVELEFDVSAINEILVGRCVQYDCKPMDASLTREDGVFQITEGRVGYELDVESSIDIIYDYLEHSWDGRDCRIQLNVVEERPRGTAEDLAQVQDLLGGFTTDYSTSNANRSGNVANGCKLINGTLLYPGEEFSATDTVSPFTAANGYALAGAYLNGKVIQSMGGGICQVSSTLYNAVLRAELEVTDRSPHSMVVTYVDYSADAAIAEGAGKDFKFRNNTKYPIYIEGYVKNKKITFNIYGKETRPENREVRYESEVLEKIEPTIDLITADASKPLGYVSTEAAHIGYKARLWKIVLEDGKEVSREVVNSSKYNVSPRSAVVGVATDEAWKYEEIMAAIGTYDLDHVRVVIGLLTQPAAETQ